MASCRSQLQWGVPSIAAVAALPCRQKSVFHLVASSSLAIINFFRHACLSRTICDGSVPPGHHPCLRCLCFSRCVCRSQNPFLPAARACRSSRCLQLVCALQCCSTSLAALPPAARPCSALPSQQQFRAQPCQAAPLAV
eukprot:6480520-Amphidinium_carterae.1